MLVLLVAFFVSGACGLAYEVVWTRLLGLAVGHTTVALTAVVAAFATMVALHSGVGQVVDVSLVESLLQMMGPLVSAYGALGYLMPRMGSRLPYTVPRSCYECADGRWVAVSTTADAVARRVMVLIGVGDDERFATFDGRTANADELDGLMAAWMAQRSAADAVAGAFEDLGKGERRDDDAVREAARLAVRRFVNAEVGKKPQTEVHLVRI